MSSSHLLTMRSLARIQTCETFSLPSECKRLSIKKQLRKMLQRHNDYFYPFQNWKMYKKLSFPRQTRLGLDSNLILKWSRAQHKSPVAAGWDVTLSGESSITALWDRIVMSHRPGAEQDVVYSWPFGNRLLLSKKSRFSFPRAKGESYEWHFEDGRVWMCKCRTENPLSCSVMLLNEFPHEAHSCQISTARQRNKLRDEDTGNSFTSRVTWKMI